MENNNGICLYPYIPVRSFNSEKSEMVTQLLFGELFHILESDKESRFSLIQIENDQYEGWIDSKCIQRLDRTEYNIIKSYPVEVSTKRFMSVSDAGNTEVLLSSGSLLRICPDGHIYGTTSHFNPAKNEKKSPRELIMENGLEWLNTPYLWGGKSNFGTDCSGLVQNLFKQAGILLPRDAGEQAEKGENLNFVFECRPGDLAFFDNEEGEITHTGILTAQNKILHASGKVKIDLFDQQGIFSMEKGLYTHKLRLIRNIID